MEKQMHFFGRNISLKGLKTEIEWMENYVFHKILRIEQYQRELSNHNDEEHTSDGWLMFGKCPMRDPDGFRDKVAKLELPSVVTVADAKNLQPVLAAIFDAHVFLIDNRKTPEQRQQEAAAAAAAEADRKKKALEDRQYNQPMVQFFAGDILNNADSKTVPFGKVPISVGAYYDNSDLQTDYYDPSVSTGYVAVVAYVGAGTKRTESLFRKIVAAIPALAAMEWEWEESSRKGYLLKSKVFATLKKEAYRNGDMQPCWLEMRMESHMKNLPLSPLFIDTIPSSGASATTATDSGVMSSNGSVTIRINQSQGGVEIVHTSKPSPSVIESIKREGFRWARFNKCWYKKDSPSARAAAERITGLKFDAAQQPESVDQGGYLLDALEQQQERDFARM